jgi:hypothetical protein
VRDTDIGQYSCSKLLGEMEVVMSDSDEEDAEMAEGGLNWSACLSICWIRLLSQGMTLVSLRIYM